MWQNLIVTAVAIAGMLFIVRRVLALGRRPAEGAACPHCASGSNPCAPASKPAAPEIHPLTLVRSKTR
jgi:hypothetical protein